MKWSSSLVLIVLVALCTIVLGKDSLLLRGKAAPRKGQQQSVSAASKCETVKCEDREKKYGKNDSIRDILKKCLGKDDCCYASENAKKCEDFNCGDVLDPKRNKRSNIKNLNKETVLRIGSKCGGGDSDSGSGSVEGSGSEEGSGEGSGSEDDSGSGEGPGSEEGSGSIEGSGSVEGSGSIEGSGSVEGSGSEEGSNSVEGWQTIVYYLAIFVMEWLA
eukprot:g3043.t1